MTPLTHMPLLIQYQVTDRSGFEAIEICCGCNHPGRSPHPLPHTFPSPHCFYAKLKHKYRSCCLKANDGNNRIRR